MILVDQLGCDNVQRENKVFTQTSWFKDELWWYVVVVHYDMVWYDNMVVVWYGILWYGSSMVC